MLGMLGSLAKAVVGAGVETPIAIAADAVTMCGALTDKERPYTATALSKVVTNLRDATRPETGE